MAEVWEAALIIAGHFIVIIIIGYFLFRKGLPTWEDLFRQLRQSGRKPSDDDN